MPKTAVVLLSMPFALLGCGPEPVAALAPWQSSAAVTRGAASPDELGFEINRFERNAVAGVVALYRGEMYQGCSATLIGDRLALLAGHCTVANPEEWEDGHEPETHSPDYYYISIGPDELAPSCRIQAESLHIHPDAAPNVGGRIVNDLGLVLLRDSVLEACAEVAPVQLGRSPLGEEVLGAEMLQGGFGSRDDTYAFSTDRRWSLVVVEEVDATHIVVGDQGTGFPSFGDSGSGLLQRSASGALRTVGVISTFEGSPSAHRMALARTDVGLQAFERLLTEELVCGGVGAAGTCREGAVFACDADGFTTDDCQTRGEACQIDEDGVARCTDASPHSREAEDGASEGNRWPPEIACAARHPRASSPWPWAVVIGVMSRRRWASRRRPDGVAPPSPGAGQGTASGGDRRCPE